MAFNYIFDTTLKGWKMKASPFRLGLLSLILFASAGWSHASTYVFTDLGRGYANAINSSGQVAGYFIPPGSGAIWNDTTPTILLALNGSVNSDEARGINDAGQVVGSSSSAGTSTAVIWNGATPTALGRGVATSINNSGQVAGINFGANGGTIAMLWSGASSTALGAGYAKGINDAGLVVGYAFDRNVNSTALVWNGTTVTSLGAGYAAAINNAGQVAGASYGGANGSLIATVWSGTSATILGLVDGVHVRSEAQAMNNVGQVVGFSYDDYGSPSIATLWKGTTATDLNSYLSVDQKNDGWVMRQALGINDDGTIVGVVVNTKTRAVDAFKLTVSAVPEPDTYVLMLTGMGLLGLLARRRKAQ